MNSARDDLVELSDYAWQRLRARLEGLTDAEYSWEPAPGVTTLAWRLGHIVDFLQEARNAPWLGVPAPGTTSDAMDTADMAISALERAYRSWRGLLDASTEESLGAPIGKPAGHYGDATRRSFVLHVLDELIHHSAEAALLRDLYAGRP